MALKLKFDANQKHQLDAVESVVRLFEGLPARTAQFALGDDVVPNMPPFESLSEAWLYDNLRQIQQENGIGTELAGMLQVDEGPVLEGAGSESWRHPSFTVEMETGTGKTYVYLRTIHELRRRYGFSKFVVVAPSIAIYEGVIKNFQITRDHFRALYSNETVNLIEYDGSRLSQLRAFAASSFVEILIITLDSFNKMSNVIFKASERLPGEHLPYQYIQATRPILILDEPQNMESEKAREALRTLHPLFSLRYSATHRTSPNLVYRLTPFDAYRMNLVKKIQVFGVTERENLNQPFLALERITLGLPLKATVRTYVNDRGRSKETALVLKQNDDLHAKTKRDEHQGYIVSEINAAEKFIEFENGIRLSLHETIGPSRPEIFRAQIRETIKQHMAMQQRMARRNVKVLSLFFIDRVANYTAEDGIIRRIFDAEFAKLRRQFPFYEKMKSEDVRSAYFAKSRPARGQAEGDAIDTPLDDADKTKEQRELEKAAFVLIMRDKERLLSFEEKTSFIFAHSALREGWDNPNVFQICTLNQTVSEIKKRQEIGRGLRLAVNQDGARLLEADVNVLTVVANESYQSYAERLQGEYVEEGLAAPPKPTNAARAKAKRNERIFSETKAFRDFWARLQKHTSYKITIDTPILIKACVERISRRALPQSVIVVERGAFVVTRYTIELQAVTEAGARLKVNTADTRGDESAASHLFPVGTDLSRVLGDDRLRGFKIVEAVEDGDNSHVLFGNNQELYTYAAITFESEQGQRPAERAKAEKKAHYPVFNLIDRAAKETGLTRPTLNAIFRQLPERRKEAIFANPEGFAGMFISEINSALADHVAERIQFELTPAPTDWGHDLEDTFPAEQEFPQRELVVGSSASLYDHVQYDSDVEQRFVVHRLNDDDEVVFYFKFPPSFKIDFPRVIGDYNPDWGIGRYQDGKILLQLVRETKGGEELERLRFPHEKRKILCARKHFESIGIDYRVVTDETPAWWEHGDDQLDLAM